MKNFELIPDARNLMESTRSIGYSLSAAVADLVDNSIAAEADRVEIWTPVSEDDHLMILDNGFGMSLDDLLTAMRYGSRNVDDCRRASDLGRFGLGLKMASLSSARDGTWIMSRRRPVPGRFKSSRTETLIPVPGGTDWKIWSPGLSLSGRNSTCSSGESRRRATERRC